MKANSMKEMNTHMNKRKERIAKKEERRAQRHLRHSKQAIVVTGLVMTTLFACMCYYMVWYSHTHEMDMFDNSYNSYSIRLAKEYLRGSIYSSDGQLLAYSEGTDPKNQTRVYPYGSVFAHAVGYSSHGRMGVESLANYYLLNYHSGINQMAESNANNEALAADSVYTTLDSRIQQVVYDSIGVYKGAAIVTEVKTGRILAMVSKPDFDPGQIDQTWDEMLEDTKDTRLLNRVTQGLYPPGSTFKIVTTLEYLRENNNDYSSYHYNCGGRYSSEGTTIQCYHGSVHGSLDFAKSFAKSCNSSFANIGNSLDRASFAQTLDELMFSEALPFDLPSSISSTGISSDVDTHNLLQGSIGQGQDSISPLHLNMITCAIANEGTLMKPYLLDRVVTSSGNSTVKSFNPEKSVELMTEEESRILTELMTGVVTEGTATRLQNDMYTAAGKTGSAEYGNVKGDSHAWFTGFAPVEDPEIAVTIIIEGAGSGGEYAVPMTKRIFDSYFMNKSD